jgi:hypothetical protein
MANPTTYASPRQFVGFAVETSQGTAVTPTVTMPVEKFEPESKWTWLDDKGLRGAMTEPYARVQGPGTTEFSLSGAAYFDTLPYLLSNMFGDIIYAGTYTGSGTTTLNSSSIAGATTIDTVATITNGTTIQIDTTANKTEVRTITNVTGAGPYTLTLNTALTYAHSGGATVRPVTSPYTDQFAVLNTGSAQPGSLTITDWQGPTASTQARTYPGACFSELSIKGTPESSLFMIDAKGVGWQSAAAVSTPTPTLSGALPMAAWKNTIGINGTVGSAAVVTVSEFEINLKRDLQTIFTAQNSSQPYFIQRGVLTASGKLSVVAADETSLTYLNSNTQPQIQWIVSNGLSGASALGMQVDILKGAYSTSKINRGKAAVGYDIDFDCIANTTNVGGSGGFGPIVITTTNAIAPNGF